MVSHRPSPADLLQTLLKPRQDEIERETNQLHQNEEQFSLWVQQLTDLKAKLAELRERRKRLAQDQICKYGRLIEYFEQNFSQ